MKKLLSETKPALEWIGQFDSRDQSNAELLLNSIKYVSSREFEQYISDSVNSLTVGKEKIAVYPIITPSENEADRYRLFTSELNASDRDIDENKTSIAIINETRSGKRKQYGSEDRVGQILENIHRANTAIEVIPNIKTLFSQGIKKIVFVDDICGTGTRITNFYNQEIPRGLKRYISVGMFEVYIVVYANTPSGKKQVLQKLSKYPNNFISNFSIENNFNQKLEQLCTDYANRKFDSEGRGYKNSFCNLVFEHGCPNNAPEILHRNSKKRKGKKQWLALFPNRSTNNSEIKEGFGEHSAGDFSEILWEFGQSKLALALCEADRITQLTDDDKKIITILGLINKGIEPQTHMLLNNKEYQILLEKILNEGLLIQKNGDFTVSCIGKYLLKKFRKKNTQKNRIDKMNNDYYPNQCGGYSSFGNT